MTIERADFDLARPRHAAPHVGDAETSFPVFDDVAADDGDFGIDDHVRLGLLLDVVSGIERRDENAQPFVHLRGGQADAVILGHRVDHVVDELLHGGGLDVASFEGPRLGAQHGVAHARDLQDGHDRGIILRSPAKAGHYALTNAGQP